MKTADLRKVGLKMREWRFREPSSYISQWGRGHVPQSTTPPPPPRKLCLWPIFFALPAMNGPLTAELKFGRTLNIVRCPFAHPVACCLELLHPFAR